MAEKLPPVTLRVADYTVTPGARYIWEGLYSGEEYRKEHLLPTYQRVRAQPGQKLLVDLDGTAGYGSSFLEECFGGLARDYPESEVDATIVVKTEEEPELEADVRRYIRDARKKKQDRVMPPTPNPMGTAANQG